MVDALQEGIDTVMPNISFDGLLSGIGLLLVIVVISVLLAIVTVFIIQYIKFNKKILLFRKVGNQNVPVLSDRAMFSRIGNAGDYWCQLRKFKKILPRPRIQMRKNEYWFYERDDGEWINFSLSDFDEQMRNMKAHYVDEDMRLQRLGIQKNLRDRFNKVTFWQRYGGMITSFLFVLVVSIMFIVLAKEWSKAINNTSLMADAVREMAIQVKNMKGSGAVAGIVITGMKK